MNYSFDIIIVGAGPAGCVCAYKLAGKGLKIAVIEKNQFPRDKICGDAVSPDVVNQLFRIDVKLGNAFQNLPKKKAVKGIRFFAPSGKFIDIKYKDPKIKDRTGYMVKRYDFDNFLFDQISNYPDIKIFQGQKVSGINTLDENIIIITQNHTFKAKMVVGADGANSIINKKLARNTVDKKHYSAGLRQYYENVSGFHENGYIELHFHKDILPGYFWIFPLEDNKANVGIGMLSSEISKRNVNLKEKLAHIINSHPSIKDRFKDAKPLESVKGFGLPMGSKKRSCSGDRFLLLGDAASLIDPFTGEGIGMAIRSGSIAADHLLNGFKSNQFDAKFNAQYDKEIYAKMWYELYFSHQLQKLLRFPKLFNFLINIARRSKFFQTLLTTINDNRDFMKSFLLVKSRMKRF